MASRISARCTAGMTAVSTTPLSVAISFSSAAPDMAPHAATRAATSAAVAKAEAAPPLVAPVMRRTPLAMPSSDSSTNSPASPVLARWVPPQNSIEYVFHSSAAGEASNSSILGPTLTTRTGSGYTSPKTARKPLIGACFGHQAIAVALGGRVERAVSGWNVGIDTTRFEGKRGYMQPVDDLNFYAFHEDQVTVLPEGAERIGVSENCENAAFVIGDHILTTQMLSAADQLHAACPALNQANGHGARHASQFFGKTATYTRFRLSVEPAVLKLFI